MENIMHHDPGGKNYQVTIGDNATGVAVGERIHLQVNSPVSPTDRQRVVDMLTDLEGALIGASRLLSPYEAHMATFHARLLRQELTKENGRASADILMMAVTWLLSRTPNLTGVLMRLMLSAPTTAVLSQAENGMMQWVDSQAAHYEAEGKTLNLIALRQTLTSFFDMSELRTLCFDMRIEFEELYGQNKSDKARELVATCVRHGRAGELATRCRELRPFAFVEN